MTSRVLDIAPYDTFSIDCTATSSVQGIDQVPLSKAFSWTLSVDSASPEPVSMGVTDMGLTEPTSTSTLSLTAATPGDHTYLCSVAVTFLHSVSDSIASSAETAVAVYGELVSACGLPYLMCHSPFRPRPPTASHKPEDE